MKHNASPEKNMNANIKGMNDIDSGKTTNKCKFISLNPFKTNYSKKCFKYKKTWW